MSTVVSINAHKERIAGAKGRPLLRYHGGKFRLAPWIVSHFPAHDTYTETFGGAASVLLTKPRSRTEVYNELDGRIVNVFRVVRNPSTAHELRRRLRLTPFARSEFEWAYTPAVDPVDAAHKTIIQSFMGIGADAATRNDRPGFRAKRANASPPSNEWAGWPDEVPTFTKRLTGVTIESKDAQAVMLDYDSPSTLHYVDPPYVRSTRYDNGRHGYRYELTDEQHRDLAVCLRSLKGMVVLSGYASDLYDKELFGNWTRVERETVADSSATRTEVLWLNDACTQALVSQTSNQGSLLPSTPAELGMSELDLASTLKDERRFADGA